MSALAFRCRLSFESAQAFEYRHDFEVAEQRETVYVIYIKNMVKS